MLTYSWDSWLEQNWSRLYKGEHLPVPTHLVHPREVGFIPLTEAEPVGQRRDWALCLKDGSRLHVHEFKSGMMKVHLDKWDPRVSASNAVKHFLFETKTGKSAITVTAIVAAGMLVYFIGRSFRK